MEGLVSRQKPLKLVYEQEERSLLYCSMNYIEHIYLYELRIVLVVVQ